MKKDKRILNLDGKRFGNLIATNKIKRFDKTSK